MRATRTYTVMLILANVVGGLAFLWPFVVPFEQGEVDAHGP